MMANLPQQRSQLDAEIDELVAYMLFGDEPRLREPVAGVSEFSKTFPQRGPRDKQGRSLRDFDLKTRLFRYPLSYMIYSAAFDGMPDLVRDRVYRRLYDILTGQDSSKSVGGLSLENLSADDRRAILEIVRADQARLARLLGRHALTESQRENVADDILFLLFCQELAKDWHAAATFVDPLEDGRVVGVLSTRQHSRLRALE